MRTDEPTRTREHGTRVTNPTTPDERIAAIRQIVTEGQYARIDGCMVDGFTASMLVQVYDALNEANRIKFASMDVRLMADMGWKVIKRAEANR